MRIVWVGYHMEGKKAFQEVAAKYDIVACISLDPKSAAKRSGVIEYHKLSRRLNIDYHEVKHINDGSSLTILRGYAPDIMIVLGWSQILSDEVLSIPTIGTIGAHASLLPSYRGSAPVNWALINGLERTGNTLMWLNPGVDSGDIMDQMSFNITKFDTCESLYLKVAATNEAMLIRSLARIERGEKLGESQADTGETLLPRRRPKDGLLNFKESSRNVYDFIRALTRPYPGAFTMFNGIQILLWNASLIDVPIQKSPGEVIQSVYSPIPEACGIAVACGDGFIILNEIEYNEKIYKGPDIIAQFPKGTKFGL